MTQLKESHLKVFEVPIDLLVENEENVNEMDEKEFNQLCEEIRETGVIEPITVVPTEDGKYYILGGHNRKRVSVAIGLTVVPAVVLTDERWSDKDYFDLVAFKINMLRGSPNPQKFLKLHERMAKKFGAENVQKALAIMDDQLYRKLTKSIVKSMKDAGLPPDLMEKVANAERQGKTPDQFSRLLNSIFKGQDTAATTNFMVFSYGNRDHILVRANAQVYDAMKRVVSSAALGAIDVNDMIGPVLIELADKVSKPTEGVNS